MFFSKHSRIPIQDSSKGQGFIPYIKKHLTSKLCQKQTKKLLPWLKTSYLL